MALTSCSSKVYQSMKKVDTPIAIDGNREEWGSPLRYYDNDSKLFFELRNDNENLYVAFSANDPESILRISSAGINLSIDTTDGKDEPPFNLTFPFFVEESKPEAKPEMSDSTLPPPPPMGMKAGKDSFKMGPKPEFHHKHKPKLTQIRVAKPNDNLEEVINPKDNSYNIDYNQQISHQEFFCEMKIPFKDFYKESLNLKDSNKVIIFNCTLLPMTGNNLSMPENKNNQPAPPSKGGGMQGPPMGGGMGGMQGGPRGGGPGGGQPMGNMPDKKDSMKGKMSNKEISFQFMLKPNTK